MRITTWNVNGLRAALRKGIDRHLKVLAPDVVMLQEVRATTAQLPWAGSGPPGWQCDWHPAQKLGYSGVATWARSDVESGSAPASTARTTIRAASSAPSSTASSS